MEWQLTPYVTPLLVTSVVLALFAGLLARWSRRDESPGLRISAVLMGTGAVWVFAHLGRQLAVDLRVAVLLSAVEHLGAMALTVVWLAYVLWYTGRSDLLTRRLFAPLSVVPVVVTTLLLTNGFHGLYWSTVWMHDYGGFVVLDSVPGPGYWLFVAFVYGLLVVSLALLLASAVTARGVFRRQIGVLLLFGTLPGAAGIAYIAGYNPWPGLNIAAMSTIVTAVAGAVSVLRFRWLDLRPVARDRAFDAVGNPVLVVGEDDTVLDCNERAAEAFGLRDPVGTHLATMADGLLDDPESGAELTLSTAVGERTFDVVVATAGREPGDETVRTVVLHDITDRLRAERELAEREAAITRLLGVAERLGGAREADTVHRQAVEAAASLFDGDRVHLMLERERELVPVATTADHSLDALPVVPLTASLSGSALGASEPLRIDDFADTRGAAASGFIDRDDRWSASHDPDADTGAAGPESPASLPADDERAASASDSSAPADTVGGEAPDPARSALLVPVDDTGVLQVLSTDPDSFDERDRELAELLASQVATALARVEAESDVRRERDRLSTFADTVAHDLRNPLSVAQGYTEMVRTDTGDERLDTALDALDRMEALIDDLLTLARHGRVVDDPEPVDFEATAREAWETTRAPGATLDLPEGSLGTLCADPARLHELLGNLFRNAMEHGMGDGGVGDAAGEAPSLTVRVRRTPDGFAVADDGRGIPPEDRGKVFDSGYTTSEDGTGLGLAIVERIAAAHDWSVRVEASEEGGARFVFDGVTFLDDADGERADVDGSGDEAVD